MTNTPLGPGDEFDLVRRLVERYGSVATGIGDDAAPLAVPPGEQVVVSTDVTVENVHFRPAWLAPQEIGHRATTAALSDLAAMGATPRGILIAWTLPQWWRGLAEQIADGIGEAARLVSAPVIGGDISDGPALSLAVTVIGSATRLLRRDGAQPGDAIWVTGWLGGPAMALRAFESRFVPDARTRDRFARPSARILEGAWLASHGATAAIDISDGVTADLAHVAEASGVNLVVDIDHLPRFGDATPEVAAASGEEYELAITAPASLDRAAFEAEFGISLTRVGTVEAGEPRVETRVYGRTIPTPRGWDHFAK